MKPTIGRIVQFAEAKSIDDPSILAFAGMITQVHEDETVELTVFKPQNITHKIKVSYSENLKAGHWSWPQKV